MIDKEVSELRRRFRADYNNISRIRGCYVSSNGEIISTFNESLGILGQEEQEKYLSLLKKAISGSIGKTLNDIVFSTGQVLDSDEHRLLTKLRTSSLEDDEAVQTLFDLITKSLHMAENYLILLAYDAYDVPFKGKDGETFSEGGDTVHNYIVCSICPVKESKPALRYQPSEGLFRNRDADWVVGSPELGFAFPAFDDRRTNIYGALYYVRSKDTSYEEFVDTIFHTTPPMPLNLQKESFRDVLTESLQEECSPQVVQIVHDTVRSMVQTHKESKVAEPLQVSRFDVASVLQDCGVSEEKMSAFNVNYDLAFGDHTELPPQNLVNAKELCYETPDVVVKVDPERADLVHTRVINGTKYLLINIDAGVELNGIPVQIED